jgi:hypothetical protein
MANEVLQKEGTMLVFGVSGSFNPADDGTNMTNGGSVTDTLTLAGVADGAARPTAGDTVDYYWAPSSDGTAGEGNVAGNSGGDADCPDGALGSITLAEFLKQCIFIGKLKIHDGASVQCGFVGILSPPTRYGQLIAVNESGDAFEDDDVEAHQVLVPIIDEVQ